MELRYDMLTHGVYINDVELSRDCHSIARAFGNGGYDTAYIGKWHVYGSPDGRYGRRDVFVPRGYQLGFDYWKGFECTHEYLNSFYFFNDDPTRQRWDGYDAFAQSRDAAEYIRGREATDSPFLLMVSWGPPHFPLHTAPEDGESAAPLLRRAVKAASFLEELLGRLPWNRVAICRVRPVKKEEGVSLPGQILIAGVNGEIS